MYCVTQFGRYEVNLHKTSYRNNGNLAITLDSPTEGPFATLTVNLNEKLPSNMAYVDVNNCPWAPKFIAEYELGKPTGSYRPSGFCVYPLYEFDQDALAEIE